MKALRLSALLLLASACLAGGCGRPSRPGATDDRPQLHKDVPPHGGTPVALSDDYNLELVLEPGSGLLSAYVLDDEMEEFMRSSSPSITLVLTAGGRERTLVLQAVANPATGETVGDTSLFQGRADWLKDTASFTGTVKAVSVRGNAFADVKFRFPEGNGEAP